MESPAALRRYLHDNHLSPRVGPNPFASSPDIPAGRRAALSWSAYCLADLVRAVLIWPAAGQHHGHGPSMRTLATTVDVGRCRCSADEARRARTVRDALVTACVAAPVHRADLPPRCAGELTLLARTSPRENDIFSV